MKENIFPYFEEIQKIPRPSFQEEKIGSYLMEKGSLLGLSCRRDGAGNVILKTKDAGTGKKVILQAHMDMVWEEDQRNRGTVKIPYRVHTEKGIMKAEGTTLGADNGIGMALILALLENDRTYNSQIEAIFTVNEEETMEGAERLDGNEITGNYLINLDSEREGVFTVGAAGGISAQIKLVVETIKKECPAAVRLKITGGKGGHSGLDIARAHRNGILCLVRLIRTADMEVCIGSLKGGKRLNAIPGEAEAVLSARDIEGLKHALAQAEEQLKKEWEASGEYFQVAVEEINFPGLFCTENCSEQILRLVEDMPHGVCQENQKNTFSSANPALAEEADGTFTVQVSFRSVFEAWCKNQVQRLKRIAGRVHGKFEILEEYPAWVGGTGTELFEIFRNSYRECFDREAETEVVHAGVECGIIMKNCPSVREGISLGPTIWNAHTTEEALDMESVYKVYRLLDHVLKKF